MRNWGSAIYLFIIICCLSINPVVAQILEYPGPDEGMRCARATITDTEGTKQILICAIDNFEGAEWYLFKAKQGNEKLSISNAMSRVSKISISPDDRYLAIESAAEGVSCVTVLDLRKLVLEKEEKTVFTYTNHMAQAELGDWQGSQLIISSNSLINSNEINGGPQIFEDMEQFRLDPVTGKVTPITANAINSTAYLIQQLSAPESYQRTQAIEALIFLKERSALPHLQERLEKESDADVKKLLQRAVKQLTKPEGKKPTKNTKNTKGFISDQQRTLTNTRHNTIRLWGRQFTQVLQTIHPNQSGKICNSLMPGNGNQGIGSDPEKFVLTYC